jgi:hypothetical protein
MGLIRTDDFLKDAELANIHEFPACLRHAAQRFL